MESRPRDEQGRFIDSSEFDKTITSARLHKGYRDKLIKIAKERGVTTTGLVREILESYIKKYEEDNSSK